MKILATIIALALSGGFALAENPAITYEFDGSFDDATFLLESAIINQGLVIDYVSHTGEMLARTAEDVGSDKVLFDGADIFMFCSAQLSRKMMEADPANIAFCPYSIFVTDRDGKVTFGHRNYPEGPMQEVQALLDKIIKEAIAE